MPEYSADDFTSALLNLLPLGRVWPKELTSVQAQSVACYAPAFQRVSESAAGLLVDVFPASAVDLLSEWEATLGLPDACTVPGSQTLAERQQAVADKLSASGGPQRSYFIQIADRLGLAVTIEEYQLLTVDNGHVGSFVYGDGWPWSWLAQAPADYFGTAEAAALDCRLQMEAPEYTSVRMGFGLEVVQGITEKVDQLFNAIHYVAPKSVGGFKDL